MNKFFFSAETLNQQQKVRMMTLHLLKRTSEKIITTIKSEKEARKKTKKTYKTIRVMFCIL